MPACQSRIANSRLIALDGSGSRELCTHATNLLPGESKRLMKWRVQTILFSLHDSPECHLLGHRVLSTIQLVLCSYSCDPGKCEHRPRGAFPMEANPSAAYGLYS